ncbi:MULTISPECIES: hypothetical protein [Paenibacillus]|uniref:hypothetical protein n=1 Tax=Paenibacillus TaxID=44249 RepID=UPI00038FEFF7|nr:MULTISPECIES: hypothetical protein [Paenibacillus]KKC48161.1 hypothetical protein VE23_15370 [Paenibacillus sp. D9]CDN41970.1 hypothetical protein BN871_AR_00070 [Paenibacillus sp. P22]
MERYLLKTALYTFLLGLALGLLLVPDSVTQISGRVKSVAELPLRDYILNLLRFAVRIALAGLALGAIWKWSGREPQEGPSFARSYVKGFAMTAAAIAVLFALATVFSIL